MSSIPNVLYLTLSDECLVARAGYQSGDVLYGYGLYGSLIFSSMSLGCRFGVPVIPALSK